MTGARAPLLELGYWLSSEEHDAKALVRNAAAAEAAGFRLAGISDHFHGFLRFYEREIMPALGSATA